MYVLRIEHEIPDFASWKTAFDNDPIGRQQSGVQRYTVYQPDDDQHYVIVDLEFAGLEQAQSMLTALRALWDKVAGKVMANPQVRILNVVEAKVY